MDLSVSGLLAAIARLVTRAPANPIRDIALLGQARGELSTWPRARHPRFLGALFDVALAILLAISPASTPPLPIAPDAVHSSDGAILGVARLELLRGGTSCGCTRQLSVLATAW